MYRGLTIFFLLFLFKFSTCLTLVDVTNPEQFYDMTFYNRDIRNHLIDKEDVEAIEAIREIQEDKKIDGEKYLINADFRLDLHENVTRGDDGKLDGKILDKGRLYLDPILIYIACLFIIVAFLHLYHHYENYKHENDEELFDYQLLKDDLEV